MKFHYSLSLLLLKSVLIVMVVSIFSVSFIMPEIQIAQIGSCTFRRLNKEGTAFVKIPGSQISIRVDDYVISVQIISYTTT